MPAAAYPPDEVGLFFILSQPKQEHIPTYHEWYNTEHGPLRLQLDFVLNGYRYQCTDQKSKPIFLAIYDLSRIAGLQEPRYVALRKNRSARERNVLQTQIDWINRRVYRKISSRGTCDEPAPVVMTVALVVRDELVPEVHRWYEQEHIDDLARIPGWRRTRRFQLTEADGMRDGYSELLAVHEFDEVNGLDGAEHQFAKSRPWRNEVMAKVDSRINRRFEFFHEFRASDYIAPGP